MISSMERRIVAVFLALFVCVTSLQTNTITAQASESSQTQQAVLAEEMQTVIKQDVEAVKYEFVPETTGMYRFYSIESGDTYGYLYDAEGNLICSDNDGGENFGFSVTAGLTMGETYYFVADYFLDSGEGTILWKVEQIPEEEVAGNEELTVPETQTEEVEESTREESLPEEATVENSDIEENSNITKDIEKSEIQEDEAEEETDAEEEEAETEKTAHIKEKSSNEKNLKAMIAEDKGALAGNYEYNVLSNNTVEITKYTGTETAVSIPAKLGGKNVSSIGKNAFANNTTIESVTIPNTVTKTQYESFYSCSNLKTVNFASGSNLATIGERSFDFCKKLEKIVLPNSMRTIENRAFSSCSEMKSLTLNNGLTTIGDDAFYNTGITSLNLVDSITKMGTGVFGYCRNLSSVKIGKGLKGIEESTFDRCYSLKSIQIPSHITYIGGFAFYSAGLTSIHIPDSVTSIGVAAFFGCKDLKSAVISNNVTYISASAFSSCGLENITIGTKVKKIDDYAFSFNQSLRNIQIPSNVTELEYAVFSNCKNLATIVIPDTLEKINGHTFDGTAWYEKQANGVVYAGKVLYDYKGTMPANTTVSVKKGTLGIAGYAFEDDVNLKKIVIPSGVTNIGEGAFIGCTSLKSVSIPLSVKEIEECALGFKRAERSSYPFRPEYKTEEEYQAALTAYKNKPSVSHSSAELDKIEGFTIYGENDSAAQTYAAKYGITFVKNKHTVKFMDGDKIVSTQTVTSGQNAKAPTLSKKGYTLSWSRSYNNVRQDLIVKAVWKKKSSQSISVKNTFKKIYGNKAFDLNAKRSKGGGKLTYTSSNKKVATVNSKGKVTIKGTGAATITVKAAETKKYKEKKVTVSILVSPKTQSITSLKTVKGKKMTVKWKKDTEATGYQIQYSTDKKFKKSVHAIAVNKNSTTSKTITNLSKGKKYYVRVCSYKSAKINGKSTKLYGKYSSVMLSGKIK